MAQRTDRIQIDSFKRSDEGYLIVNAKPTRAGIFKYINADGTVRNELRHPDEVFKQSSMDSLRSKPLTDLHPASGKVTSRNSKQLMVGFSSHEVSKTDDDFLETKIIVTDEEAIRKIESGEQAELSCGYDVDVTDESGEYKGEKYDAVQRNIKYNHIACVPRGRAGGKARIYCDNIDDATTIDFEIKLDEEEEPMTTKTMIALSVAAATIGSFKVDAITFEIDKELQPTIQPVLDRCESLTAHAVDLQSKVDAHQGTIDQLTKDAEKTMTADALNKLASDRADVLGVAGHVGLEKFDDKNNLDIKRLIITKKNEGISLDEKSDAYIEARYDAIVEQVKNDTKGFKSLSLLSVVTQPEKLTEKQKKDAEDADKSPRDKYLDNVKDLHKDTVKSA